MDEWYVTKSNPLDELNPDVRRELQEQCSSEEELVKRAKAFLRAEEEDAMCEAAGYTVKPMSQVAMMPVRPQSISSVGYEDGTLYVHFHRGEIYAYFDVPASEYEALRLSGEPGRYFAANIRQKYKYRKSY